MEEAEQKTNSYELAVHLSPHLEETERGEKWQEIENLITQNRGMVTAVRDPKKQRLSYPIAHQRYSFFGVFNFRLPTEALEALKDKLQRQEQVLRFLVLNWPENQRVLRHWSERESRGRIKTYTPPAKREKEGATVKPEEMEKQIEEAIEKI